IVSEISGAVTGSKFTRPKHVLRGDSKVTPIKVVTFNDPYTGTVTLVPGKSRIDARHPWVLSNPDLFQPSWSRDSATRSLLVAARSRNRRRPLGRAGSGRYSLDGAALARTTTRPPARSYRLP